MLLIGSSSTVPSTAQALFVMQRKAKHWIGCHDWPKHQGGRQQGEKFTTADQRRERLKRVRWLPHTDLVALVRLVLAHDADAPADVRPQPAQNQPIIEKTKSGSRVGIALVGAFATIAGIGEIIVGLTGNYLGILTHSIPLATSTIIIGAFYSLGGLSILTMRKLGAALGIFFHRLRSSGAPIPSDDWHRSLDRRRRTQDRHWRRDCARRHRLRAVAVEKVRLDRVFGGGRRVEMAIVHELVEFGAIPGNAQTF